MVRNSLTLYGGLWMNETQTHTYTHKTYTHKCFQIILLARSVNTHTHTHTHTHHLSFYIYDMVQVCRTLLPGTNYMFFQSVFNLSSARIWHHCGTRSIAWLPVWDARNLIARWVGMGDSGGQLLKTLSWNDSRQSRVDVSPLMQPKIENFCPHRWEKSQINEWNPKNSSHYVRDSDAIL